MRYFMSSQKEKILIPGNFKLGKAVFTFALLNNQNEIRTQRKACSLLFVTSPNINKQIE